MSLADQKSEVMWFATLLQSCGSFVNFSTTKFVTPRQAHADKMTRSDSKRFPLKQGLRLLILSGTYAKLLYRISLFSSNAGSTVS